MTQLWGRHNPSSCLSLPSSLCILTERPRLEFVRVIVAV